MIDNNPSRHSHKPRGRTVASWPNVLLVQVPPVEQAAELARQVRRDVLGTGAEEQPLTDLKPLLRAGGFSLSRTHLFGRDGGLQALLAPRSGNWFSIEVDPEPQGGWRSVPGHLRRQVAMQRLRFRVCHEIAHSFFYDRTVSLPRRVVTDSPEQERFCDRFASALLLPEEMVAHQRVTPASILRIQARYGVSLRMTAQSFADAHPHAFLALLVANGEQAPYLRLQWRSSDRALPVRWWTASWLQDALSANAGRRDRDAVLQWNQRAIAARWRALPGRRQVLLSALTAP